MTSETDLRDRSDRERRDRLRDALDAAEPGETLRLVADREIHTHLLRYQIDRGRAIDWEREDSDERKIEDPDAEPREIRVVKREALGDGASGSFDVRDLVPQRRHELLLDAFDRLDPGEGFVLVNDHDPKPLYHELRSLHGDVVGWEYERRGSGEWRVAIERTGASATDGDDADVITRFDVREIPKSERHETIHHRYGMIPDGETMELVAPHEPRPLRGEFRERYGDAFDWEVVEKRAGRCRVRITKAEGADSSSGDGERAADEAAEAARELDVRDLPPAKRHDRIFGAYAELDGGEGFVLVNDHDPKPLYHQFDAEAGPEFRWEYRRRDPGEFRVLIGKAESSDGGSTVSEEPSAPF